MKCRTANYGGNWQGKEFLSYREHDMVTRLTRLGPTAETRAMGVHAQLTRGQAVEIVRQKRPAVLPPG